MGFTDLPSADKATINAEVASGQWIMVAMCDDPDDHELLDGLLPDDDENYDWYRVDANSADGRELADAYDLDLGTQFIILSLYKGRPSAWVLDDLDERDPEDIAQFMDDHAGRIELDE